MFSLSNIKIPQLEPSAIWYDTPATAAGHEHEVNVDDPLLDDDFPGCRTFVHAVQAERVRDSDYSRLFRPVLLPCHIAFAGADDDMRQLHEAAVAWNATDMFLAGADNALTRLPMSGQCRKVRVRGVGMVPLPERVEGPVPDPSRRVAQIIAYGEYVITPGDDEVSFRMDSARLDKDPGAHASIVPDRGVYEIEDGKWLIGRRAKEDPLAVCLRMVQMEGSSTACMRNALLNAPQDMDGPRGSPAFQAQECARLLGPGAILLSLDGKTHREAMQSIGEKLEDRHCGILFTQGHVRVLDHARTLGRVFSIGLRDPQTCSARWIRDHMEFWRDEAASSAVTPVPDDWVHGPADVLVLPPPRLGPRMPEQLA
ncbi:hypothetical protein BOSP111201_15285 [Bordetella sputigena]|uniref:hypothetical protein n=1 Tax=Bordetella sputigena TaxID=1416810 RepID=UPI0039EF1CA4